LRTSRENSSGTSTASAANLSAPSRPTRKSSGPQMKVKFFAPGAIGVGTPIWRAHAGERDKNLAAEPPRSCELSSSEVETDVLAALDPQHQPGARADEDQVGQPEQEVGAQLRMTIEDF